MNITINPFQQLFLSDDAQVEESFVELFSAEVLQSAIHPVFQGGNVVLSGTQGCGKTMILNLLRPETRIAYWRLGRENEFPVGKSMRQFISAGMNLTRSRIADLVQITLNRGEEADFRELPFFFADFFNYLVVDDLISSIEKMAEHPQVFDNIVDPSNLQQFVSCLAAQDCWFGSLTGIRTIGELRKHFAERINFYRSWVNGNYIDESLPEHITTTKTVIGEPISRAAECLRASGVVGPDVPVLIRIDQIEELHRSFTDRQRHLLLLFRKMLNRVFAARDARVHYRVGTRKYGWNNPDFLGVWGSEARLENRRDYNLISMDEELFARREIPNSIFERFAIDAFQKRIRYYFRSEIGTKNIPDNLAKTVFGPRATAGQRIDQLTQEPTDRQIDRALGLDLSSEKGKWSPEWRDFLRGMYRSGREGMLDAVLAAAWGRQTGGAQSKNEHRESPPPDNQPWKSRQWWRKERLNQAVLQLTTRCQQRFMWWGFQDICSLSGGNITIFFHICHRIWDGFQKSQSHLPQEKQTDLLDGGSINKDIQDAGILFASNEWFNKLPEEPGGDSRRAFVEQLGMRLNSDLMNDLSMSYPGGSGISLTLSEFSAGDESTKLLRNFINEAIGYAAIVEREHSSKSKLGGRRIKFYLNPILCPRFQLPEAKTKEPFYWTADRLFDLLMRSNVNLERRQRSSSKIDHKQYLIPGFED